MQEDGTQYTQRPAATRAAAARMLSTVPLYTVGDKPGRPVQLHGELIELRSPGFLGEQERFGDQDGDRDAVKAGEPVAGRHQDPERILAEQQRGNLRRAATPTAQPAPTKPEFSAIFRVIAGRAEFRHSRAAVIGDLHTDDAAADLDRLAGSARLLCRTLLPKARSPASDCRAELLPSASRPWAHTCLPSPVRWA